MFVCYFWSFFVYRSTCASPPSFFTRGSVIPSWQSCQLPLSSFRVIRSERRGFSSSLFPHPLFFHILTKGLRLPITSFNPNRHIALITLCVLFVLSLFFCCPFIFCFLYKYPIFLSPSSHTHPWYLSYVSSSFPVMPPSANSHLTQDELFYRPPGLAMLRFSFCTALLQK